MKITKPQSVSVKNRHHQELPGQVRLNEKIDKYTSLRLASILNNADNEYNTEQIGNGPAQRTGIKSAGIHFGKISPQERLTKLQGKLIQDFKPVKAESQNFSPDYYPNTSDQLPSQASSIAHKHTLIEKSIVTSTKNQTLDFSSFNFNNAIKDSRNDPKRKLIGTSGLTTGAVVQCDTKDKLAKQVCRNLIGESPAKVKSGLRNKFDQNLTQLNLLNLQFNRRSEKSQLFQDNLEKNQSIITSVMHSQKLDDIFNLKQRASISHNKEPSSKVKSIYSPGQISLIDSSNFRQN